MLLCAHRKKGKHSKTIAKGGGRQGSTGLGRGMFAGAEKKDTRHIWRNMVKDRNCYIP